MPPVVNIKNLASGEVRAVSPEDAREIVASQPATWAVETPAEAAVATRTRQVARDYSGLTDQAAAFTGSALDAISGGLATAGARAILPDSAVREYKGQIDANPGLATAGTLAGSIAPAIATGGESLVARALTATPAGQIARLGTAITRTGEGAGALAKVGRAAAGAGVEGVLYEAGAVTSDLALAEDGDARDRIAGSLGSRFLATGSLSAGAGGLLGGLEHGLSSARKRLLASQAADAAPVAVADDLAALDRKGLRAAEEAEVARIEAERVPQRAQLGSDINAYREATKDGASAIGEPWIAVATGDAAARKQARKLTKAAAIAERKAATAEAAVGPRLPAYAELGNKAVVRSVPARDLAGRVRALPGVGDDAVKLESARKAIAEGQRDPIRVALRGDGTVEVVDGRHRLLAAMEADKPIRLKIERGVADAADDGTVLIGEQYAEATARRVAAARKTADEAKRVASEARAAADAAVDAAGTAQYPRWMREQQKLYMEGDKYLDRVLRNPKALAENPRLAKSALQQQEHALELIQSRADELAAFHATDRTGRRAAAMQRIPAALDANRALQQRIDALLAKPSSARLSAITDAVDTVGERSKMTMRQKIGAGLAFGAVMGAASGVDLPGMGYLAPVVAAGAGAAVASKLGGTLAKTAAASRARTLKAVEMFASGASRARKVVAPLSTRVLAEVRFAPESQERRNSPRPASASLADHFADRAEEIARTVQMGPDGKAKVTPAFRQAVADRLAGLASAAPVLADRLESHAVRRQEFLADKLPRTKQIGMTKIPPSEMAIRAWARYVAAANDPDAIEERLADGSITPEDAEVMRELYPDRMATITRMVAEKLGELRGTLPYARRLHLSIFTRVPVDAAMEPRILRVLQQQFVNEPNSAGGTQAPKPQPAFGSVEKPKPTPAQERAA